LFTKPTNRYGNDQRDFNRNFWLKPGSFDDRSAQTKEFTLMAFNELSSVLDKIHFKIHRREDVRENRPAVLEELTDVWKYLLSMMQVWDVTPEEFIEMYWRKSMVVRQRFSEEFLKQIKGPCAIVDIDNVLCDYVDGFLDWIDETYSELSENVACVDRTSYLTCHSLQIDDQRWQEIKHHFRTSGAKSRLPLINGAQAFMESLKRLGLTIVVLTSRPIDQYPNMYADTLEWLSWHDLPYDHVWWSPDKKEKVLEHGIRHLVKFAVDDELRFCERLADLGIQTYWFNKNGNPICQTPGWTRDRITFVKSLRDIPVAELA
jgi:hypothetical protein